MVDTKFHGARDPELLFGRGALHNQPADGAKAEIQHRNIETCVYRVFELPSVAPRQSDCGRVHGAGEVGGSGNLASAMAGRIRVPITG